MSSMTRRPLTTALLIVLSLLWITAAPTLGAEPAPAGNDLPGEEEPALSPVQRGEALTRLNEAMHPAAVGAGGAGASGAAMSDERHAAFQAAVDVTPLRRMFVFDGGRVKILDTLAREHLERVYGKPFWVDPATGTKADPVFTYLDMGLNPQWYADKPVVHVELLPLRRAVLREGIPGEGAAVEAERERWLRTGAIAPQMWEAPGVQRLMRGGGGGDGQEGAADLQMLRGVEQMLGSMQAFAATGSRLLAVSPESGGVHWYHVTDLPGVLSGHEMNSNPDAHEGHHHGGTESHDTTRFSSPSDAEAAGGAFTALREAWGRGDADAVNRELAALASAVPGINPHSYPPAYQGTLERFYNFSKRLTIGWVLYVVALVTLLIAVATRRRWMTRLGAAALGAGLGVHLLSILIRSVLLGHWTIHNQYESFIALTFFAGLVGMVLMLVRRQPIFGAAAAALGAGALFYAFVAAIPSEDMGRNAAILHTSWILYVHVNIVAISYGMIALSFFLSLGYLGTYYLGGRTRSDGAVGLERGVAAESPNRPGFGPRPALTGASPGDAPSRYTDMVSSAGGVRGGSAGPRSSVASTHPRPTFYRLLDDLDKAQLVVLQLAFWLLAVGILLGAYWADHSWGRWWGWDPKETFALITWMVYLVAIHTRLGVRNKGLVTAWLSVLGFGVMLWCYWGVNLFLAGLHSYA